MKIPLVTVSTGTRSGYNDCSKNECAQREDCKLIIDGAKRVKGSDRKQSSLSSQAQHHLRLRMITKIASLHMKVKRRKYLQFRSAEGVIFVAN